MFTGGEMVPYERAKEFEDRTGAHVLQFYGSNETGALSCTTPDDPQEKRLRTAGKVIPEMHVRLLDPDTGADIATPGGPGVPAGKGPALCLGYYDDPAANDELFTADGWMRMGDLVTIDADGYLTVVGRTSDIIIRGGKNISAAQVEDEVASHPAIALCGAVAVPDATFGERVCVFVEMRTRSHRDHPRRPPRASRARGTGKELWPERLVVLDDAARARRAARSPKASSARLPATGPDAHERAISCAAREYGRVGSAGTFGGRHAHLALDRAPIAHRPSGYRARRPGRRRRRPAPARADRRSSVAASTSGDLRAGRGGHALLFGGCWSRPNPAQRCTTAVTFTTTATPRRSPRRATPTSTTTR